MGTWSEPVKYAIYRKTFDQFSMLARARRSDGTETVVRGTWTFAPGLSWYDRERERWIPRADWHFTEA